MGVCYNILPNFPLGLVVIGIHVAAALLHIFVHRDRVMRWMLPG